MKAVSTLAAILVLVVPVVANASSPLPVPPVPDDLIPDPTKPLSWSTIQILTPIAGAEVGGKLLIEGKATPTKGYAIRYVSIYVDGIPMGNADGTEDWSYPLDTRMLLDGNHTFAATAYAAPKALIWSPLMGVQQKVGFRSFNHQLGVVLFEKTYDVAAVGADATVLDIGQDYTGLRVTLKGANEGELLSGPVAQLALAYKDTRDGSSVPVRTWTVFYGPLHGGAFISKPPHGVLKAPGVLTLAGTFAGEGTVTVKVEAVPLSAV